MGTSLFQDSEGDFWVSNSGNLKEGDERHAVVVLFAHENAEEFARQFVELISGNHRQITEG